MTSSASVIVVTYNSARWIRACLEALLRLSYDGLVEIIVIDNGSADATCQIVSEFSTVRLLRKSNRGFGAGNNAGADVASGEILAFVNPDTVVDRDWLRELVKGLAIPKTITTSKIVLYDEPHLINTCGNTVHLTGLCFTRGFREPATSYAVDHEVSGISGAAFAMRSADFKGLGGFDEDYFLYLEDTEFSWRARRAGFRIVVATGSIVRHAYELRFSTSKLYYLEKGRQMIVRKHFSRRDRWTYAPSLIVASGLAWALAARHGWAGLKANSKARREARLVPSRVAEHTLTDPAAIGDIHAPLQVVSKARLLSPLLWMCNGAFWLNATVARSGRKRTQSEDIRNSPG